MLKTVKFYFNIVFAFFLKSEFLSTTQICNVNSHKMSTSSQLASSSPALPACKNEVFLVTNVPEEQLLTYIQLNPNKNRYSAVPCLHSKKSRLGWNGTQCMKRPFGVWKGECLLSQVKRAPSFLPREILRWGVQSTKMGSYSPRKNVIQWRVVRSKHLYALEKKGQLFLFLVKMEVTLATIMH